MENTWKKLEHISQIEDIKKESEETPVLIFKHSTRCSISAMAWDRLKRKWKAEDSQKIRTYYLDLIAYRNISDAIAKEFSINHESPQVILIKNGKMIYNSSHMGINHRDILSEA